MLWGDLIFLAMGIIFGFLICMNTKEWKEQKTYEQLDEELRKELDFYKNTCHSQRIDVQFYKDKTDFWKKKYESKT